MKSDYKILLFCLLLVCAIVGVFVLVDSSVDSGSATVGSGSVTVDSGSVTFDSVSTESDAPLTSGEGRGEVSLVRFDPNTADSTTLMRLGLQPWMVRGILKYRRKGGVYYSPEDFARVPGLTVKKYKELLPYITISEDYREARTLVGERRRHYGEYSQAPQEKRDTTQRSAMMGPTQRSANMASTERPVKMAPTERLALNTADTTSLKKVPGIGSYFAKKLVDYREKLGGFVCLDQLLEIKNFPESALQYLTIPDGGIRKININKADFKQLAAHPYIGYSRTKVIVDYRRLKGKITSLSQLSLLKGFSAAEIEKIEPYITY